MGIDQKWYRSSYCAPDTQHCVEVAIDGPHILMRDSKNPKGPVLRFSLDEWRVFVRGVVAGEFS